jgi:hypothetical protein
MESSSEHRTKRTAQPIAAQSSCSNQPDNNSTTAILPHIDNVLACQFSSWYPIFSYLPGKYKGRKNVTIPSIIISPLPDTFREYLLSDQLILPCHTRTSSALLEAHPIRDDKSAHDAWSSDDECDASENDDLSARVPKAYSFPSLSEQINSAIQSFSNQACVPKLNWSAPKDAIWINGGSSMECRCAGDVFLLLKASDFCSYDLQHAIQDVIEETDLNGQSVNQPSLQLELILRKWCNLYPSQEFRCFVVKQKLIAISQRYHSQHWPHLLSSREHYQVIISDFFTHVVQPNVVSSMTQYVFDVYIDQKSRIWLIDINVWATRTDALLFHWSELLERASLIESNENFQDPNDLALTIPIEFRIVESEHQILTNPLSNYKTPIMDMLYLGASESKDGRFGSSQSGKFQEFMKMCERPTVLRNATYSDDSDGDDDPVK